MNMSYRPLFVFLLLLAGGNAAELPSLQITELVTGLDRPTSLTNGCSSTRSSTARENHSQASFDRSCRVDTDRLAYTRNRTDGFFVASMMRGNKSKPLTG